MGEGGRCELLLLERFFVVPAPLVFEFGMEKAHTPASLFADLVENLQDFLLLASDHEAFRCYGEGAKSDAGNTSGIL